MFSELLNFIHDIWGSRIEPQDLDAWRGALRAIVVYGLGLLIVRLGPTRGLDRNAPFDTVLGIMIGAILSRAVNGSGSLVAALSASAALVAMNWLFGFLSFRSHAISVLLKGMSVVLVKNGELQKDMMSRNNITKGDIEERMRLNTNVDDIKHIKSASLERNGEISVVTHAEPHILDVKVENGVQTVRILLESSPRP